jgi:hypothetical protein
MNVNSNLLEKYYYNFGGMLKADSRSPKNLKVSRVDSTTASIILPINRTNSQTEITNRSDGTATIGIDRRLFDGIIDVINRFVNLAINKELMSLEFCPLEGYSFKSLSEDLLKAIEAKRDLLFVDTYQNYLDACNKTSYTFNQYIIPYGTSEWADAIILIESGKIKELKEKIKPLLKKKDWC